TPAVLLVSGNGGAFQNAAGTSLNSAGGDIAIISGGAGTFSLYGSLNAGANNVQIGPSSPVQIDMLPSTPVNGSFNIISLNKITAGGLSFGSTGVAGNVRLDKDIDVSGQ